MAHEVTNSTNATHIVNCVDDAFFLRADSDEDAIAFCESDTLAQSLFTLPKGMDGPAIWSRSPERADTMDTMNTYAVPLHNSINIYINGKLILENEPIAELDEMIKEGRLADFPTALDFKLKQFTAVEWDETDSVVDDNRTGLWKYKDKDARVAVILSRGPEAEEGESC